MTAVYRAFDVAGVLLYVGIAKNWGARWAQHAERSPFFAAVARLDVRYVASREEALALEAEAVRTERPVWNKKHAPRRERRFRVLTSRVGGLGVVPAEWLDGASLLVWVVGLALAFAGGRPAIDPPLLNSSRAGEQAVFPVLGAVTLVGASDADPRAADVNVRLAVAGGLDRLALAPARAAALRHEDVTCADGARARTDQQHDRQRPHAREATA